MLLCAGLSWHTRSQRLVRGFFEPEKPKKCGKIECHKKPQKHKMKKKSCLTSVIAFNSFYMQCFIAPAGGIRDFKFIWRKKITQMAPKNCKWKQLSWCRIPVKKHECALILWGLFQWMASSGAMNEQAMKVTECSKRLDQVETKNNIFLRLMVRLLPKKNDICFIAQFC